MKGKYVKRYKRFHSRFVALLSSLVLIIGLAAGATIAYLADDSDAVVNTFTPGKTDITVVEIFTGTTKSDVKVSLTSDSVNSYVRARVIINWVENGKILAKIPEGYTQTIDMENISWTKDGEYYYYNGVVTPGNATSNLINSATFTYPAGGEARLQIEILAESIQAEPASAAQEAWGVTYANSSWT